MKRIFPWKGQWLSTIHFSLYSHLWNLRIVPSYPTNIIQNDCKFYKFGFWDALANVKKRIKRKTNQSMIDQKFNSLPWQGICDNSVTSVDFCCDGHLNHSHHLIKDIILFGIKRINTKPFVDSSRSEFLMSFLTL